MTIQSHYPHAKERSILCRERHVRDESSEFAMGWWWIRNVIRESWASMRQAITYISRTDQSVTSSPASARYVVAWSVTPLTPWIPIGCMIGWWWVVETLFNAIGATSGEGMLIGALPRWLAYICGVGGVIVGNGYE